MIKKVTNKTLEETMQWQDKGSVNGSSYNWHKNNPVFWEQFNEQIPNMQQLYSIFHVSDQLVSDRLHTKRAQHAMIALYFARI